MTTLLTYPEDTLPPDLAAQVGAMSRTEYPAFYAEGAQRPPRGPHRASHYPRAHGRSDRGELP